MKVERVLARQFVIQRQNAQEVLVPTDTFVSKPPLPNLLPKGVQSVARPGAMQRMREKMRTGTHKPVKSAVIIGGGPAGLSAAIKLAEEGVKVTIVEARDENYVRPHHLNARQSTLDALADLGVYKDVQAASGWVEDPTGTDPHKPRLMTEGLFHGESARTIWEPSVAQVRISDVERALYARANELGIEYRPHTRAVIGEANEDKMYSLSLETGSYVEGQWKADGQPQPFGTPDLIVACDGAGSPTRQQVGIPFLEVSEPHFYLGGHIDKKLGPEYRKMVLLDGDERLHLMATGHARYPQTWVSVETDASVKTMTQEQKTELLARRASQIMEQDVKPEDITWGAGQITIVQNRKAQTAVAGNNLVLLGDSARTGSVWVSGGLNLALTGDISALLHMVKGINERGYSREGGMSIYDARVRLATECWHRAGAQELS